MKPPNLRSTCLGQQFRILLSIISVAALLLDAPALLGQQPQPQTEAITTQQEAPKIPNDQLDSLVAPIALYPDPLLAQTLAASTYPLEIVQLEQWLKKNPNLKQDALANAVAKQPWDASVQAMAIYPDVVTRLSENVAWTTDLGNAFLAQQSDVMAAIQRMRGKAEAKGALKTSQQQKVATETVDGGQEVITIEPANPQYAYVPSYDPEIVYGPPAYPYPVYSYPGYVPGTGLAFGTGIVLGAAWANNWGNCNWHGGGDININRNNNFNRNTNITTGNRTNVTGKGAGSWQHNPQHRGGAPYGDRGTANKYGGRARQQPAGAAGNRSGAGAGGVAGSNRLGGSAGTGGVAGANRPGGGAGAGGIGGTNRPGGTAGAGGIAGGNRAGGGAGAGAVGSGNRPLGGEGVRAGGGANTIQANRGGGGANSIGNRSVSSGSGFGSSNSAFGGGGGGSARSASARGGSSMGGGGFSGGGGRAGGGGGRGGGGGGRR